MQYGVTDRITAARAGDEQLGMCLHWELRLSVRHLRGACDSLETTVVAPIGSELRDTAAELGYPLSFHRVKTGAAFARLLALEAGVIASSWLAVNATRPRALRTGGRGAAVLPSATESFPSAAAASSRSSSSWWWRLRLRYHPSEHGWDRSVTSGESTRRRGEGMPEATDSTDGDAAGCRAARDAAACLEGRCLTPWSHFVDATWYHHAFDISPPHPTPLR